MEKETEKEIKISCPSCLNDTDFIFIDCETIKIEPKIYNILVRCAKCGTDFTFRFQKNCISEKVPYHLRDVIHLVSRVKKAPIEEEWIYEWSDDLCNYDFSRRKKVRHTGWVL